MLGQLMLGSSGADAAYWAPAGWAHADAEKADMPARECSSAALLMLIRPPAERPSAR